jgi:predicted nucleic-acid-binding protein
LKITADTNILVRAITGDDPTQSPLAQAALAEAELIAIPTPALCELVWVLQRGYGLGAEETAAAVRGLAGSATAALDGPAVEAGLAFLEAGGDFADGVIAYEGAWLGGEVFVSFDEQAVRLTRSQGGAAWTPA